MITEEKFKEIEYEYGCGYWHVCDYHACPCHPTAIVSQGFDPKVYYQLGYKSPEEQERFNKEMAQLDRDLARYKEMEEDGEDFIAYMGFDKEDN